MKEKYYVISPNGEKIGPADIVELTKWAREGKILPENTVCDTAGETCNARDIISFMKIMPKKEKDTNINTKGVAALVIVLTVIMSVCAVAYVGLRANYETLRKENAELVQKYETVQKALKSMEEENTAMQSNAEDMIQKMVTKYNLLESEKQQLSDQLNSAKEQNRALEELKAITEPKNTETPETLPETKDEN